MSNRWHPHVTVASIVEHEGRFLLVEEQADARIVLNQPAGHWEAEETLLQAVVRETLEETAYHILPRALVGIYRWPHPEKNLTYLRFAFHGIAQGHEPTRALDQGIVRAVWLTPEELRAQAPRHRSPLVLRGVEDYLAGKRYPLDLLNHLE